MLRFGQQTPILVTRPFRPPPQMGRRASDKDLNMNRENGISTVFENWKSSFRKDFESFTAQSCNIEICSCSLKVETIQT